MRLNEHLNISCPISQRLTFFFSYAVLCYHFDLVFYFYPFLHFCSGLYPSVGRRLCDHNHHAVSTVPFRPGHDTGHRTCNGPPFPSQSNEKTC